MKSTVLIKECASIQLGHLYEHIVCIEVENKLRKMSLYSYSDYCLSGKTFHGGLIYIELTQYNGKKIDLIKLIKNLDIKFTKNEVLLGLNQISAELNKPLTGTGMANIIDNLKALHSASWELVDDFISYDASDIKIDEKPLSVANGSLKSNKRLNIEIRLNDNFSKENRSLIPLFRQISYLLIINIENNICNTYGYFSPENSIRFSDDKYYSLKDELRIGMADPAPEDEIYVFIKKLVAEMQSNKAFSRFSNWLRNQSYSHGQQNHVNLEQNYEDTLIFVGAKGWKTIARVKNIERIFENISFNYHYEN